MAPPSTVLSPPAPLDVPTVLAGFEVAALIRAGRATTDRSVTAAGIVEFSRPDAADRLTRLLDVLDLPARRDTYLAGGRHRYLVHRVVCADLDTGVLGQAWHTGCRRLCAVEEPGSARQRRHRADLAAAVWRAALLAAGQQRGPVAVRITGTDLAMLLVRAGRVLGMPVAVRSNRGLHVVQVTSGAVNARLWELAPAG